MIQIISNNRSETETNTSFLMDIKKLRKECYEELCDNKFDNLDETNQFLERHILKSHIKRKNIKIDKKVPFHRKILTFYHKFHIS